MFLKSITRFFALAPLFLIPFFPLIVANNFFFPFITGKAFYFRILVEIAFLSWVILAALDAKYRPKWNSLTIGVTVFTLIALVADLLGVNPIRSLWSNFERMEGWITIIHLWMFYMVTVHTFGGQGIDSSKRMWRHWLNTSLVVAFIVACYGFAQYIGVSHWFQAHLPAIAAWFHANFPIHQSADRVDASLGNAEYMAVYMLISAGFAIHLLLESKVRRGVVVAREASEGAFKLIVDMFRAINLSVLEWIYGILAVAFSFLIFETGTRGTTFGLIGAIILALILYVIFAPKENNKSRIVSGSVLIAIFILAGIFWIERDSKFVQNSPALSRIASISMNDITTSGRAYIWPMAITGAMQRPVLGWGQENFNYIFNANYNPKMYGQEQWFDRAHSVYLDWLINAGIVGLLAYLALYVLFLMAVWKSTLTILEKSALTGLLAGYAAHNFLVFDNLASYVLFFALLGFAASLKMSNSSKEIKPVREITSDVVEYVVAPVAIITLIFGIYWYNVRPIQENTRLISALQSCGGNSTPDADLFNNALSVGAYIGEQEAREQVLSCAGQVINAQQLPGPTKQAFFDLATNAINDQVLQTPKDARVYTLGGSFFEQIGSFSQALPLLEKAHLLSPAKQSTDLALGNAYINLGKFDQAVTLLKNAYLSETTDNDAKVEYIVALIVSGNDAQAQTLFPNDPNFNTTEVAQAYTIAKQYQKAIDIYQSLLGTSTDNVNLQTKIAQTQYAGGQVSAAIATLKLIEKNHPEYAGQIDGAIKQIQK